MTDKSMTGLTLHKCALALAAILIATPALDAAPDSIAGDEPQSGSERWLQAAQQEQSPQTVGTLRPPVKVPGTTGAKLEQPATTSAKHAMPAATSKVANSKTLNSKLGASNHSNANHDNSKQEKLSKSGRRAVNNKTPADITGSVLPRSVLPALY
jgi:hypothetical protein